MYVLNMVEKTITKMNNFELADFLSAYQRDNINDLELFYFIPTKKLAKLFITKQLKQGLPQCQHWK
jgi:hypothetical protein